MSAIATEIHGESANTRDQGLATPVPEVDDL